MSNIESIKSHTPDEILRKERGRIAGKSKKERQDKEIRKKMRPTEGRLMNVIFG